MSTNSSAAVVNLTNAQDITNTCDQHIAIKPLKICLLGYRSAPYSGGQGIYLKYLSKALVDAGHNVDVISGQPYPHLDVRVKLIKMPGMNLFETGLGSIKLHHLRSLTNIIEWSGKLSGGFSEPYCFGRRVYKYLKKAGGHYDIVHDNQCLSWGVLKLQRRGIPLVTTIHHPISSDLSIALNAATTWGERLLIKRWHSFLDMQKKVAKKLSHVVTVSKSSQQDIATAFAMSPSTISVVYNGIDTEEFKPDPTIEKIPFRIMATTSADSALKGGRYLLEAVSMLVSRYPHIELLLVGKLNSGSITDRLLDDLGIRKHVKVVSGISTAELVCYYAQAQAVVVPSVYEGFGLPAGEAMACGVAVVSTVGGALPEVVADAGIQVPIKDSVAIAEAVASLFEDTRLREQLALAGRQRIVSVFCWRHAAEQMVAYYQQVIAANTQQKLMTLGGLFANR